jgi:hypothetical protein
MFQMFHLDVSKVDLGKDMLQWSWWLKDSGLPQSPVGAPSWGHCAGAYGQQMALQCAYVGRAGDWDRSHSHAGA